MDKTLLETMAVKEGGVKASGGHLRILDDTLGKVEINLQNSPFEYDLKPLSEIYDEGTDACETHYAELSNMMMSCVLSVQKIDASSDQDALRVLDKLSLKPEVNLASEANTLARRMTLVVSYFISTTPFSRQDLRKTYRKFTKAFKQSGSGHQGHQHGPNCRH